jgi:conjugal transfer pilus assembly protein TraK
MNRTPLARLLLPLPLLASAPAPALQVVEARDGVTADAVLSNREPTRIRIEGAAITDVFGNIHSSNCAAGATAPGAPPPVNPAGEVVLECDRDKGEIYVRPVGSSAKPVNLFVSSASATYTLLLRRADTPADTIVIRDRTPRQSGRSGDASARPPGQAAGHVRGLKAMLVAMASDQVPPEVRVEEVDRPLQLWAEARFALVRTYEARGLVGEAYRLTNVSAAPMTLAEQEFDRDGGEVLAVAIEHHNLRPGETTQVFVIRAAAN